MHKHHGGPHGGPHSGPRSMVMAPFVIMFILLKSLFCGVAITCFLYEVNRIAGTLKMEARMKALDKYGDAFTDAEREVLIIRIKHRAIKV